MKQLEIGTRMPEFSGLDQKGNAISSKDFAGKKLIIFFYPKASTPGCTAEACNLRDNYQLLEEKGFKIIGVSADSEKRQLNFSEKNELNFPLIADEDKQVINAFGVWGPKKFMGREYEGIIRKSFIMNEKMVIEHIVEKVKTKDHAAQILSLYK